MVNFLSKFTSKHSQSEVALERLLLTRVLGRQYFYLTRLEPHVQARVHPTGNVRKGNTLVDAILEERYGAVACVIQDAQPRCHLLTLAAISEDSARLKAVFVDGDEFERPDVPVYARWRIFPKG